MQANPGGREHLRRSYLLSISGGGVLSTTRRAPYLSRRLPPFPHRNRSSRFPLPVSWHSSWLGHACAPYTVQRPTRRRRVRHDLRGDHGRLGGMGRALVDRAALVRPGALSSLLILPALWSRPGLVPPLSHVFCRMAPLLPRLEQRLNIRVRLGTQCRRNSAISGRGGDATARQIWADGLILLPAAVASHVPEHSTGVIQSVRGARLRRAQLAAGRALHRLQPPCVVGAADGDLGSVPELPCHSHGNPQLRRSLRIGLRPAPHRTVPSSTLVVAYNPKSERATGIDVTQCLWYRQCRSVPTFMPAVSPACAECFSGDGAIDEAAGVS
jgi:hypothetical protein